MAACAWWAAPAYYALAAGASGGRHRRSRLDIVEAKARQTSWRPGDFWDYVASLNKGKRLDEALQAFEWWKQQPGYRAREEHFVRFMVMASKAGQPHAAQGVFDGMEAMQVRPSVVGFSALVQSYAESGEVEGAQSAMKRMLDTGIQPNVVTYGGLIRAYGKRGLFDEMAKVVNTMKTVRCEPDFFVYKNVIEAYASGGLVGRMDKAFKAMRADGWIPDSDILNLLAQGYASMGMIKEMEGAQGELRRIKGWPREESVRACALAYIRHNQFYQMEGFVKSLGMKRIGGNLLWNLLLLAHAANFSMKSLQREAVNMWSARCAPDVTTFNIRALALSRMQMLWDLHVLVQHMRAESVRPDLVTYGALVDAYAIARLLPRLPEQLDELDMADTIPDVRTDPLVFQAFGRGRFHAFCDAYVRSSSTTLVNYSTLTTAYLDARRTSGTSPV
ncbi:pentatricopeptide repeat-containing protein At3g42630 [Selaginella moellendorffii]|nr:pentatricopeptide repeat-containing protein At3g42630 [Selaginella moellendorffii]|eukprot:XP_002966251.2 pentatricopeptide repeat-containing protein At3g42630 [Selaginella moellendorffii]